MRASLLLCRERGKTGRAARVSLFGRHESDANWRILLADQARHNGRLFFRVAYGVLRNAADAEDSVQRALAAAWEGRAQLRDAAKLRSWLARTVLNDSLRVRERQRVEQRVLEEHAAAVSEIAVGPEAGLAEVREAVLKAIERLPENIRLVVVLRLIEKVSGNETAQLLGCSAAEVSKKMHLGMKLLRGLLADWRGVTGETERESNDL